MPIVLSASTKSAPRWRLRALSLGLLLPLVSLLVWAGIVAVPFAQQLRALHVAAASPASAGAAASGNATVALGSYHATLVPSEFAPFALNAAILSHSHALTALYLPGALLEIPLSLATTVPEEWYPKRLNQWTPLALAQPVESLPFFYVVGLALDALLGRRRLRWPLLAFGTTLCGVFGFVLVRFVVERLRGEPSVAAWVLAGVALWVVLLASFPAAWLVAARRPARRRLVG
jgi:hypothetical protein